MNANAARGTSPHLEPGPIRFYGRFKAYENRWVCLNDIRGALNTAVIETEALWGNEIKEVFSDTLRFETQLWVRIHHQMQLENPEFPREDKKQVNTWSERVGREDMTFFTTHSRGG